MAHSRYYEVARSHDANVEPPARSYLVIGPVSEKIVSPRALAVREQGAGQAMKGNGCQGRARTRV